MKLIQAIAAVVAAAALASTAAFAAEKLANNEPMTIDGVEVVCGGASKNDRADAKWRAYPLRIEFVGKGGQYLGGETVTITGNEHEISVQCQGPWVMAKLPRGSYKVAADVADAGHKDFSVRAPGVAMVTFPNAGGVITRPVTQQVAQR